MPAVRPAGPPPTARISVCFTARYSRRKGAEGQVRLRPSALEVRRAGASSALGACRPWPVPQRGRRAVMPRLIRHLTESVEICGWHANVFQLHSFNGVDARPDCGRVLIWTWHKSGRLRSASGSTCIGRYCATNEGRSDRASGRSMPTINRVCPIHADMARGRLVGDQDMGTFDVRQMGMAPQEVQHCRRREGWQTGLLCARDAISRA